MPANDEKLKPCPFCGEEPSVAAVEKTHTGGILVCSTRELRPHVFWIKCENRECQVYLGTKHFKTQAEAIKAWNTRNTEEPTDG